MGVHGWCLRRASSSSVDCKLPEQQEVALYLTRQRAPTRKRCPALINTCLYAHLTLHILLLLLHKHTRTSTHSTNQLFKYGVSILNLHFYSYFHLYQRKNRFLPDSQPCLLLPQHLKSPDRKGRKENSA